MTSWQTRVRLGLAIFGLVFAVLVYRSIGVRQAPPPPPALERIDPKAIVETTAAAASQDRGAQRAFDITWDRSLTYEDRSARHFNVTITVRRGDARTFVITAKEALAGPNQVQIQLSGDVTLAASDGFTLETAAAAFDQHDGVATVPDALRFRKGRMAGSGRGATYDQRNDVLAIRNEAHVTVTDAAGAAAFDFTAGTATLDRLNDVLFLESDVHVLRSGQTIEADRVMARLSPMEDLVTAMELRGHGRVRGGDGSIEAMSAEAIDLDYGPDGESLDRVVLNGNASVATAATAQTARRTIRANGLDVELAEDGQLTRLTGRERVGLDLHATASAPPRSIQAESLDATGQPGTGLTAARFRDNVVFQEGADGRRREARARALVAALDGDGVSNALFTGGVTFSDGSLTATAVEVRYQPLTGELSLSGGDSSTRPLVADERIRVEARTIDVTLDGHAMAARGEVRTALSGGGDARDGRLPGLLEEDRPASINADSLDYAGANGRAVYSGAATLVQGETAIRGEALSLDQQRGDLLVSGGARSSLVLDAGRSEGRADEIRYDDARRVLTYSIEPVAPTTETAGAAAGAGRLAQVSGPEGDLRARRIEIVLGPAGGVVERLEAYTSVTMTLGARTAVGARMTYHAAEGRYVMAGEGIAPVALRESCREMTGRTLTFFKSTDRIVVDGNETGRTETRPCTPESSR